ncbi:MAG: hypothetical protein LC102_00355 [Ignavibacteriales bacterium]|mgnify:CR=1 FL=1|nr:MAG: hypothetical protein F9K26_03920 [Ignavibacteriaceae bacterium]MBW7872583.1 hypothetical protein [Ignavibacteria bacterium]MCZ2141864.1 hypothetical protein [Ignavibacteriales bacterium]MBV6445031.1 hypothetical protein [Ignavibacteriaceae bacterium]MBZ0197469.1 hypothetical protein [Ignavibacteriaceae bacterium]
MNLPLRLFTKFRFLLFCLVLPLFLLSFSGCFSSTTIDDQKTRSQSDGDDFFNLANNLINRNKIAPALIALDEAYNSYSLLDDVSGKSKVLLKKVTLFAATNETEKGDSILSAELLILPSKTDTINLINSLTEFYYNTKRYDSVLAVTAKFNTSYLEHPKALIAIAYLALTKFALGQNIEMELANLNRAFVAFERDKIYPPDQLGFAYYTRAFISREKGDLNDAEFWGMKAWDKDLQNEDYQALAYDLELLAKIAEAKADFSGAAGLYKRASDSYNALGIERESVFCEVKSLLLRLKEDKNNSFLINRLKFLRDKITDAVLIQETDILLK